MSSLRFQSGGFNQPQSFASEQPMRIDDARFDAWAHALGQVRSTSDPPRRPQRGQLPDLDLSRAVPLPARPSWWERAWAALVRRSPREGGAIATPGAGTMTLRPRPTLVIQSASPVPHAGTTADPRDRAA
jgi:hypothetical protein